MIVMEVPDIPTTDIRGGPPSAEPRNRTSNQKNNYWLYYNISSNKQVH